MNAATSDRPTATTCREIVTSITVVIRRKLSPHQTIAPNTPAQRTPIMPNWSAPSTITGM
tara:strand:- start:46 stop:225 length:180 start_codon:yes stop_codon:yes gene_type:complete